MTKADFVHSTPRETASKSNNTLSDLTRRGVLSIAIGAAAMAAAADGVQAVPFDPVLAAIENHKAACRELAIAVTDMCSLERLLPAEACRSHINMYEKRIVSTDDARWIASERRIVACHRTIDDTAIAMVTNAAPATIAGLKALLSYVVNQVPDWEMWPDGFEDPNDPDSERPWQHFLIKAVLDCPALQGQVA